MTLTAPLAFVISLIGSAILSRPKLPELEPEPSKDHQIAELKEELRLCQNALDAASGARDRSDAQLRTLTRRFAARIEAERGAAIFQQNAALLMRQVEVVTQHMDSLTCNCVPGRHQLFFRSK